MQASGFLNFIGKNIADRKLSTVYANQTNLNEKLRKTWRAKHGANQKSEGPWLTQAPLRIATIYDFSNILSAL